MPEEGFRYGPFRTYQVPITRIEELADLKFSKTIRDADVFTPEESKEMVATARYIEITSEADIVLTSARTLNVITERESGVYRQNAAHQSGDTTAGTRRVSGASFCFNKPENRDMR